ncbi:MAG: trehalose-6-phosphate synthase [Chloroflexi bacterium]|nr:trehalose-6-phosphate synthase [Chloroflexota bacterium]
MSHGSLGADGRGNNHSAGEEGSGTAVAGRSTIASHVPVAWLAVTTNDGDASPARRNGGNSSRPRGWRPRLLTLRPGACATGFAFICDPVLRLLQHGQWGLIDDRLTMAEIREAWEKGYLPAGRLIAGEVLNELPEAASPSLVSFQGHRLYGVPAHVRAEAPDAVLSYLVDLPWPPTDAWQQLPSPLIQGILDGLLACDLVAFRGPEAVFNFLLTCYDFIRGVAVDFENGAVTLGGRRSLVRAYPLAGGESADEPDWATERHERSSTRRGAGDSYRLPVRAVGPLADFGSPVAKQRGHHRQNGSGVEDGESVVAVTRWAAPFKSGEFSGAQRLRGR